MMNELLLQNILSNYRIMGAARDFTWTTLPEYPHVIKIAINEDYYYLKEIVASKAKKEHIEKMYSVLEKEKEFIHPIKNVSDCYLTTFGDDDVPLSFRNNEYCYLLTKGLSSCMSIPSAKWWANSLLKIHKKTDLIGNGGKTIGSVKTKIDKSCIILPSYMDTVRRMERVNSIMETDVKNLIKSLYLNNKDDEVLTKPCSLVHGDPLCSNVLLLNSEKVLFDFESSGFSIKEYDIQRLFADVASNCRENKMIDNFVSSFLREYEKAGARIDISVLDYFFRIDLINTICWLYETSISYNRQDYSRQRVELEKYKMALRSGCYHRVISAIYKTWQYNLSNIRINDQEEIQRVAKSISTVVPDFVCATLGGSRAHFLDDSVSDVEMYFYSGSGIPDLKDINKVLKQLGALHRRSNSFLWNEEPWGAHSFFEINGLYFEIGYRTVEDIKNKISKYLSGKNVEPQKDCHDLGLGYLYSGLTSSVQAEKIVICQDDSFFELKNLADTFPESLRGALINEYMRTAESLIKGKLYVAAQRQDTFLYNVLATRIIRCLMIMAFSVTGTHFPGDKWNEILLLHTKWKNADRVLQLLNYHMKADISCIEKQKVLMEAYEIIDEDLRNPYYCSDID